MHAVHGIYAQTCMHTHCDFLIIIANSEAPLLTSASMSPTGEIFANHSVWSVQFDKQVYGYLHDKYYQIVCRMYSCSTCFSSLGHQNHWDTNTFKSSTRGELKWSLLML